MAKILTKLNLGDVVETSGGKSFRRLRSLPPLEDYTWEEISAISAAGKGAEYFKVGDKKSVYIKGTVGTLELDTTLYVYIIGFDHNKDITGDTGITFGTFKTADGVDVALCDSKLNFASFNGKYFNMNHWDDLSYGGWAASDLRYDVLGSTDIAPSDYGAAKTTSSIGYNASTTCATNPVANTLMAALPEDLRAVMKPMTTYADSNGNSSNVEANVTASVDYLPLLAEFEVCGKRTSANQYEQNKQAQYAYYAAGNYKLRKKYNHSSTGSSVGWLERSACSDKLGRFCQINISGESSDIAVRFSSGLAPIFLV